MSERLVLEADHLAKHFGSLTAVRDLSLGVREGDIYGFLGPNGAGKTTAIRMMLGLVRPSRGTARIFGHDVRHDFKRAIRFVGAMVEGPAFYGYLSGRRNLKLFGGLSGGVPEARIEEVLRLVGLEGRGGHKVRTYSHGMRQRLGIGLALLERPRLLVLDEPTNGLDPHGMREMRTLIRRMRDEESVSVFLSSHLLGEMELICDRLAIIFRGEVIQEGRLDELVGTGVDIVVLEVEPREDAKAVEFLRERHGLSAEMVRRGSLEFRRGDSDLATLNRSLVEAGFSVASLFARRRSLEEYFVDLTGESRDLG